MCRTLRYQKFGVRWPLSGQILLNQKLLYYSKRMIRGEINTIRRDERNAKNCHLIPHRLNPTINILEFKILSNANLKIE